MDTNTWNMTNVTLSEPKEFSSEIPGLLLLVQHAPVL